MRRGLEPLVVVTGVTVVEAVLVETGVIIGTSRYTNGRS
jgi:hypothetical protein